MKILLDECVPWPMSKIPAGHECQTPLRAGWSGLKNGDLLRKAEEAFDLFITSDQNIRYQQNLAGRLLPILELSTWSFPPTICGAFSPLPRSFKPKSRRFNLASSFNWKSPEQPSFQTGFYALTAAFSAGTSNG